MGSFAETLRRIRFERHMTQEELAELLGTTKQNISRYESGAVSPKINTAAILAEKLNISLSELAGEIEYSSPVVATYEKPNIENAALKATEILIKHNINSVPILPMSILQAMPNVLIVTFTEFADKSGMDRSNMVTMFGAENQDVITYAKSNNYYVAYNQRLPYYMLQRAMARELGHIVLDHHTSSLPWEVQATEALYFMRHLLCPRPLLKALFDEGILITVETLGNITGLYGRSLAGIRETPGAHITARMNKKIRDQFSGYIGSIAEYMRVTAKENDTNPADFGNFMDGYEE